MQCAYWMNRTHTLTRSSTDPIACSAKKTLFILEILQWEWKSDCTMHIHVCPSLPMPERTGRRHYKNLKQRWWAHMQTCFGGRRRKKKRARLMKMKKMWLFFTNEFRLHRRQLYFWALCTLMALMCNVFYLKQSERRRKKPFSPSASHWTEYIFFFGVSIHYALNSFYAM